MPEQHTGLRERIAGRLVVLLMKLLACLPLGISQTLGRGIGRLLDVLNIRAAKVTRTNLELCLPDLDPVEREALAKQSLIETACTMMETPGAWLGNQHRVRRWIKRVTGEALLDEAEADPRGVVILLPHCGNWELINVYLASREKTATGLYAPPGQAWLRPLMEEVRGQFGNEVVPTTRRGLATLFKRVGEGVTTVVLPDQVPASGVFVPFFGHDALTDKLIARLVAKTGAQVLCCVIRRLEKEPGFELIFIPPHEDIYATDELTAVTGINKSVEACVALAPAQYQWEYKRFRERPPGALRLYNYKGESSRYH